MKKMYVLLLLSFFVGITTLFAQSQQQQSTKVYRFKINEDIAPGAWRKTKQAMLEAREMKADVIILELNTYGGALNDADSIRSILLTSPIKTIVFINNNAASAGALIALACDRIYMHAAASIGAASVVNGEGKIMPEKYQSYMRSIMRATAEAKGRDPRIAEAFVDSNTVIEGTKPLGKVLTLTTSEAIKLKICEAEAKTYQEVLKKEGIVNYQLKEQQLSWTDRVLDLITSPAVSGVLIMLIIGGIYFEMQSPGIGFALAVAIGAATLYFAPLYLQGLAANWEILLFIVGLALLAAEIFVIPGFGITGILGTLFVFCGLAFSLVANNFFDFSVTGGNNLMSAFATVLLAILAAIVLAFVFGKSLYNSYLFRRMVLTDEQKASEGFVSSVQEDSLIGKIGLAQTDLRPSGKILVGHKRYDALSEGEFIPKGSEIRVVKHETMSIFVRKNQS